MNTTANEAERQKSFFAVLVGSTLYGGRKVEFGGEAERDSPLLEIPIALNRIEFDLQDLIVHTDNARREPRRESIHPREAVGGR